jgi:hypothetical protein
VNTVVDVVVERAGDETVVSPSRSRSIISGVTCE